MDIFLFFFKYTDAGSYARLAKPTRTPTKRELLISFISSNVAKGQDVIKVSEFYSVLKNKLWKYHDRVIDDCMMGAGYRKEWVKINNEPVLVYKISVKWPE